MNQDKRLKDVRARLKQREEEKARECIQTPDLISGYLYQIHARNARFGIWLPQRFSFLISRVKFSSNYLFEEIHFNASDWHGTARPMVEMERSPFKAEELNYKEFQRDDGDIYLDYPDSEEILEYLNMFERDDPERKYLLEL